MTVYHKKFSEKFPSISEQTTHCYRSIDGKLNLEQFHSVLFIDLKRDIHCKTNLKF